MFDYKNDRPIEPAPDGKPFGPEPKRDQAPKFKPAPKPAFCADCGGAEFWQPYQGGRWFCSHCRPQAPYCETCGGDEFWHLPNGLRMCATCHRQPPHYATATDKPKRPRLTHAEIWPLMGIHAQDTKHGGAWRLSVLFSALDHGEGCDHPQGICKGGSGKIERAKLESIAINDMRVKRSTFFSWLADARAAGIFRGEGDYLYIASQDKLAQIFLCNTIDRRKATIPLKLLFKPGWKGIVWAAYLKANHHTRVGFTGELKPVYRGNVVSEKTLEAVTGVLPRQQRRLSQRVDRKRQYAITTIHGSYEKAEALNQAARDHGQRRHYFTFNDPAQEDPNKQRPYKRVIAYTKPSRRTVDDKTATPAARGRRRSILESLRLVNVCNYPNIYKARPQQAGPLTEGFKQYERLYLETATQQDRAESGYIPRIGRFGKLRNVWDEYNAPQWGRSD